MILAMGHERQCVHERHGPIVIVEAEGLGEGVAVLGQFPARHLRQQFAHARFAETVLAAAQGDAMGLDERNEVVHGGLLAARRRRRGVASAPRRPHVNGPVSAAVVGLLRDIRPRRPR